MWEGVQKDLFVLFSSGFLFVFLGRLHHKLMVKRFLGYRVWFSWEMFLRCFCRVFGCFGWEAQVQRSVVLGFGPPKSPTPPLNTKKTSVFLVLFKVIFHCGPYLSTDF